MAWFNKRKTQTPQNEQALDPARMPRHVAIIMDGNGRWAAARGLPRLLGHRAGMEAIHGIVQASADWGIQVLTLYAFSTENWSRPREEVQGLMDLLIEFLQRELDRLHEEHVRIRMMGEMADLPAGVQAAIQNALDKTANNNGLVLNLALNYGGRQELLRAVQQLVGEGTTGELTMEQVEQRLYSAGLPDPDLVIRTSGEQRLSNFMPYQAAYAELWFCPEMWPDFTPALYQTALISYQGRERRYGGVVSTV